MTPEKLAKDLEKSIAPVYLVLGNSGFLVERCVEMIKKAAVGGGFSNLNLDAFRAGEDDLSKIPKIARTFPMMAARRVIVISEAENIPPEFVQTLNELAKERIDTCCFIAYGEKFDKRGAFAKAAKEGGGLIEIGRPTPAMAAEWAPRMAKERGKKLSQDASSFLAQQLGTDLAAIDKEIEKAALYVGAESDVIEAQDIRAVMVAPKIENVFDLMDAVGTKNRAKALFYLDGMLEAGNHPLRVHASLYNHMKKLLRARDFWDAGRSRDGVIEGLGGHPFPAGKIADQAKNCPVPDLKSAIGVLSDTDFELKNGRASNRIILEKMILELCGRSKGL